MTLFGRVSGGLALFTAVVLSSGNGANGADTKLRWKFTEGQTLNYTLTTDTTSKATVGGQDVGTKIKQTMDMTWKIKSVAPDGSAKMEQTIDRVRFDGDLPEPLGQIQFDTKGDKEIEGAMASMGTMLRAVAGKPFELTMTARGEIKDVTIPPALIEAMKKSGPAGMIGGSFSEDGLKNLITQGTLLFPEDAIAPGKSWNSSKNVPTPPIGSMVMELTYIYNGPSKEKSPNLEDIDLKLNVAFEQAKDSPVKIALEKQDNSGDFQFDNTAGRLKSSKVTQNLKMVLTVMGMEIIQEVTSNSGLELAGSPSK